VVDPDRFCRSGMSHGFTHIFCHSCTSSVIHALPLSFLRRQESSRSEALWIPASAGMTRGSGWRHAGEIEHRPDRGAGIQGVWILMVSLKVHGAPHCHSRTSPIIPAFPMSFPHFLCHSCEGRNPWRHRIRSCVLLGCERGRYIRESVSSPLRGGILRPSSMHMFFSIPLGRET